ncbi:MAG TPA: ABC transporter permease [Chitinophagales bacterium]|nr:ABC transporter permease [Chitinophagales bacterium]
MASPHHKDYKESPLYKAWKRLKKNKPAVISLGLIIFAIFLAVFAPLIAPDGTPDANDQVLELTNKNPNYSIQMLLVKKNQEVEKSNIFQRIAHGTPNPYKLIPITDYQWDQAELVVQQYKGDYIPAVEERYSIPEIAYGLPSEKSDFKIVGNNMQFTDAKGVMISQNLDHIKKQIDEQNIIQKKYWLGTDNYGRDILSRLLFGVRVSISVGFIAVMISMTIGIFLGAVAGYFKGYVDNIIMWLINVIWAVPTILLAMALTFALDGRVDRFWVIYLAVGLSMWVEVARIVRGQVMSVREMEYIQAAKGLGYGHFRTIFKHILPNIIGPIMVIAAADFASAILIEAGLSLVGIGVRPPMPSWGVMLNEQHNYLFIPGKAFLALAPGIAIMILVLAFNLLGNGLRDAFDVKGKLS